MARAKRIYEIAKEFTRDEKEIMEFLTAQGIRVANRLSAVNEDTYNMLKVKFTEPPKVEEPEPPKVEELTPAPAAETQPAEEAAQSSKKKKKNKNPQAQQQPQQQQGQQPQQAQPGKKAQLADDVDFSKLNSATQDVYKEAIQAGNLFISHYTTASKRKRKVEVAAPSPAMDSWGVLQDIKFYEADESPALYWKAVNKLTTAAYKNIQNYGVAHREELAEMREALKVVGDPYVPREIFTDEENERFAKQQWFLFTTFGHGQGALNEQLLALKIYCERMFVKFEQMNFVEYLTDPDSEFHVKPRVPFATVAEVIAHSVRSFPRRFKFYAKNKETILFAFKNFFEWIDGYQKLKEAGADEAKLKKYLELEEKFIYLTEFMSFDNLLFVFGKNKDFIPYKRVVELMNIYRDNMDDPEAESTYKYDLRGQVMNLTKKPKEYVFLWQLAGF